jgi:hypothetical protein
MVTEIMFESSVNGVRVSATLCDPVNGNQSAECYVPYELFEAVKTYLTGPECAEVLNLRRVMVENRLEQLKTLQTVHQEELANLLERLAKLQPVLSDLMLCQTKERYWQ